MPVLKVYDEDLAAFVEVGGGASALDGLTDVTITTPTTGEALVYNGSAWVNDTVAGGADIPYQNDAPSTPADGDIWIDKDAFPSTGGSLLVAETTVSGSAVTSVTFSGLDGNAAGGYVLDVDHVGAAANNTLIAIYLNGDTTASNYQLGSLTCFGASTVSRSEVDAPAYTVNTDIGKTSHTVVDISANGTVMCRGYSKIYNNLSTQTNAVIFYFAQKKTLANVTAINLVCTATGGIGIGSTFRLYRRK